MGSIWGLILFLEFLHQEGGDVHQGHDSMIHGPILPPATVKLDLYSRASWGMHAMLYLFIFFFWGGGGEAIAIQLTHPTHNSTHVMTPTWGGGQKPNMFHFMLTKCLDLFREVLRKYTTSNEWNDNNPEIISCFFVKVLLLGLKWKTLLSRAKQTTHLKHMGFGSHRWISGASKAMTVFPLFACSTGLYRLESSCICNHW